MHIHFLIRESLQVLRHNILRSLLTMIGIIVGIVSVTAMLGLGGGLSANILDRFSAFAAGDVSVVGAVSYTDFSWIATRPYVRKALAKKTVSNVEVIMSNTEFSPTVTTVIGDYQDVQQYDLVEGETFDFSDPTFNDRAALITTVFRDAVMKELGYGDMLGQTLSIGGQTYHIVGVIDVATAGFGSGDGEVIIPYATVVGTLSGTKEFSSVAILLKEASYYEIAGKDLLAGLNASRYLDADSEDVFRVQTAQSIIESIQETTRMITLFLAIIGGIALFVGGIGTMNMMLTSVTERTKEIGLRKAVGARDRDILLQILIESVVLTTVGGVVGIAATALIAYFVNQFLVTLSTPISILISWNVMLLAFLVACIVGIVFGIYPARRASLLQPVDALRSE